MVRLSDIGARAGPSASTVSIVLGDRASPVRISAATRQAVLDAARELGYTPNLAARRLRSNGAQLRTIVLAIAYPIDSRLSLIGRVVHGVEQQLQAIQDQLESLGVTIQLTIEAFELGKRHKLRGLTEPVWFNGVLVSNNSAEDDAEFAAYHDPALTTVRQPTEEMGARATAILLDLIYQRASAPIQEMFPARLVVRQSTVARVRPASGGGNGGPVTGGGDR